MVSGYWQPNSVIVLIFSSILFSSIDFGSSDLRSSRDAIEVRKLNRAYPFINSIKRFSENNLENGPIISNSNRYSEYLQAESSKGSNFNEIRCQKIRTLKIGETGLNKINNMIIKSRNYHPLAVDNTKRLNEEGLSMIEDRRHQIISFKRQNNRFTTAREVGNKRDLLHIKNVRGSTFERSKLSETGSTERVVREQIRNRKIERINREVQNIDRSRNEKPAIQRRANIVLPEQARENRLDRKVETNRLSKMTGYEQRSRESKLLERRLTNRQNENENFKESTPVRANINYRTEIIRKMDNERDERYKLFSRSIRRTGSFEHNLIKNRRYIRRENFKNYRNAKAVENPNQMINREDNLQRMQNDRQLNRVNTEQLGFLHIRDRTEANLNNEISQKNLNSAHLQERQRIRSNELVTRRNERTSQQEKRISLLDEKRITREDRLELPQIMDQSDLVRKNRDENRNIEKRVRSLNREQRERNHQRDIQQARESRQLTRHQSEIFNENIHQQAIRRERDSRQERSHRRERIQERDNPQQEPSTRIVVDRRVNERFERQEVLKVTDYLQNERRNIKENKNILVAVADNLFNQKAVSTQNIILNLIQGLLIGVITFKVFSHQNSKKIIGVDLNYIMQFKCF